jgi:flagellar basal-body rod modification protein FlgD
MSISGANNLVSKDDFLNLFVTQMKYQNPLNPMDNTEFTAQLAQFSSLEQLTNINSQLTDLLSYQNSLHNTLTASFIGKNVKFSGDQTGAGTVTGVSFENNATYLVIDGQTKISLGDITEIS